MAIYCSTILTLLKIHVIRLDSRVVPIEVKVAKRVTIIRSSRVLFLLSKIIKVSCHLTRVLAISSCKLITIWLREAARS